TDEMLVELADPEDIVSLSPMVFDAGVSTATDRAARFADNGATAEEIVREKPDLVLAGLYSSPVTIGLLRRLGYRVEQVPIVESLAAVPPVVRRVAGLIGQEERGERWIAEMDRALAAVAPAARPTVA